MPALSDLTQIRGNLVQETLGASLAKVSSSAIMRATQGSKLRLMASRTVGRAAHGGEHGAAMGGDQGGVGDGGGAGFQHGNEYIAAAMGPSNYDAGMRGTPTTVKRAGLALDRTLLRAGWSWIRRR